jgi:acetyltransferase-like isoleucine patch superfamily enzyme
MNRISSKARIGRNVVIGDFSVVGDNVVLGAGTIIGTHCHIGCPSKAAEGKPLVIGAGSQIRSHSILYEGSTFGAELSTGHGVLVREKTRAGKELQIGSQTDIEGDCEIGDYVKIHSDVHVAQHSRIGDFVFLHPRVQFTNDPFPPSFITAGITIKDMAVVCTNSLLLPGITIGLGSFVAAGSVVKTDVPDVHCVAGNPAVVFSRLDRFFHPAHGLYHPWVLRFRAKYPPECEPLIRKIIARIDRLLAKQASAGRKAAED